MFNKMFETRKRGKLDERRLDALSGVHYERWQLEAMAQRSQAAGETPDDGVLSSALTHLSELEQRINGVTDIDELDSIGEEAEEWGTFSAYICPPAEIEHEGNLAIDVMEEWYVPKAIVERLRTSLGSKLNDTNVSSARSALKMIFMEKNSWLDYTDDYEDTMKSYTRWLSGATIVLVVLAIVGLYFRLKALPTIFLGALLCGGAAGSCVSVMLKLPLLDVSLSGELDAYWRRILSRVVTGTIASLIGCALFAILPVSVQGLAFSDVVSTCTAHDTGSCTTEKFLILLALPILLGFSERTLASVERRVLGDKWRGSRRETAPVRRLR
jgi:hypothetical protein